MKIVLGSLENIYNLMRQCGYHFEREDDRELAFIRIIGQSKSGYPRFHAYVHPVKSLRSKFNRVKIDKVSQETIINIHLDQKKPSYKGALAHSAEYDSEIVKKEAARVEQILGLPAKVLRDKI